MAEVMIEHVCGHTVQHRAWGKRVKWLATVPCPNCAGFAPKPAEPTKTVSHLCEELGMLSPLPEYRFTTDRRWRFDWAWPDYLVALEVDGGIGHGGRHDRIAGWDNDTEKRNAATLLGWRVFLARPKTIRAALATVKNCMDRADALARAIGV